MNFLSWFLFIYFINDIFYYNYPDSYNDLKKIFFQVLNNKIFLILEPYIITITLDILYYFSIIEIKYNNFKNIIKPYISQGKQLISNTLKNYNIVIPVFSELNTKIEIFDIDKDFDCVKIICSNNKIINQFICIDELIPEIYQKDNYFIVITSFLENETTNKIIFRNLKNNTKQINNKISSIQFISLILIINSIEYDINLKKDNNYYMLDNILDKYFFFYYLKYIIKDNTYLNLKDFYYKLNIIDNNVNMFNITEKESIKFDENLYTLEIDSDIINTSINNVQEINSDIINTSINNVQEINSDIINLSMNNNLEEINRIKSDSFGEQDYIKL